MSWLRTKPFALAAGMLGVAAILGGSLGVAAAGTKPPLFVGMNLMGGPTGSAIQPDAYLGCLPANSWAALYSFDSKSQTWKHYYPGVPGYVNASGNGGISLIDRYQPLILMMSQKVDTPKLRDTPSEPCS